MIEKDCDTCAHDDTPDTLSCDACGAVAAATGERWTLHVPKQALSAPRAPSSTIPITPAPFAQPEPASQAGGASVRILKAPSTDPLPVTDEETAEPFKLSDPPSLVPAMVAVAAILFCMGVAFGLLIASAGAHQ